MAVYKRDIVDINLETGNIHRSFLKHSIGYKDQLADHFGIRVFRNGEPVSLTGVSVQGIFMPPQGSPIAITSGNIVNYNEAEVVLPQACYNYNGQFTLAIKLVDPSNAVTGTMRIVDGMVDNTNASGTVAPVAAIPSYQEVLSTYEQAILTINKSLRFDVQQDLTSAQLRTIRKNARLLDMNDVATEFSTSTDYNVGDYCYYNGDLYRFTSAHPAGAWDDADVTAPDLATDLANGLRSEALAREAADTAINNKIGTVPSGKTVQGQIDTLESGKVPKTTTVNGHALSANVTVTKADVGLGNVDNTSDVNKPVSTAQQAAIDAEAATRAAADADLKSAITQANFANIADVKGKYIDALDEEQTNAVLRHSDYIAVPDNAVSVTMYVYYTKTSTSELKTYNPICIFYDANKTKLDYYNSTGHVDGYRTVPVIEGSKFVRFNVSNVDADADNVLFRFNTWNKETTDAEINEKVPQIMGFVGNYSGTFTEQESLDTGILLKANTEYHIVNKTSLTKPINIYCGTDATNYKRLASQYNFVNFMNGLTAGTLKLYNVNENLDSVSIDVYERETFDEQMGSAPMEYSVSKFVLYSDYTSLTQCLLDLKNDEREKIIHIYGGDYDIFQEYIDAGVTPPPEDDPTYNPNNGFFPYNVWVPKNTHIIGHGLVRLIYMPTAEQTTYNKARTVSALNVAATATIENIEIHCKNGRYCIHNDSLSYPQFQGATQKFINVKCYKYAHDTSGGENLGTIHTIGFGIGAYQFHEYISCEFNNEDTGYAFYGHATQAIDGTNINNEHSSEIKLVNCSINTAGNTAVKLGTVTNTDQHIRTRFIDCYLNKKIKIEKEGGTTEKRNPFDVMFIDCGNVELIISDTNNPFPPNAYRTRLTLTVGETNAVIDNSDYATLSNSVTDLNNAFVDQKLLFNSSIPGTVETVTFGSDGKPSEVAHTASGNSVRDDTFVWTDNTVTETRTLANGKYVTLETNLTTLVTTISEIQEEE